MSGVVNLFRADKQPYAQIPNAVIRNPKITANAFRLLAYLMSHQNGYTLKIDQITAQTGLGYAAIASAEELLIELGYLRTEQHTQNGRFVPKNWIVLDPTDADSSDSDGTNWDETETVQSENIRKTSNKKTNTKKTTQERRANLFSEDWKPDDSLVDKLRQKFPTVDLDFCLSQMISHIIATGKQKEIKNMSQKFANWVERERSYQIRDEKRFSKPVETEGGSWDGIPWL